MIGDRLPSRLRCLQTTVVFMLVAVLTVGFHCAGCKGRVTDRRDQQVVIPPHVPKDPDARSGPHILPRDAIGIPLKEMDGRVVK